MKQPEKIKLTTELIQTLLNYLNTRPHGEVRQLIDSIQQEATKELQGKN